MSSKIVLNRVSYHGKGAIQEIVTEVKANNLTKAFICTDADLVKFGVVKKVTDLMDKANLTYEIFSDVKPNPTIENIQSGVEAYKKSGADYIITIGGGSPMDTAKGVGIIIANPEFADVRSLEGAADTKNRAVFTIAIPTTAGTASEVTTYYVVTDVQKSRKFVCVGVNVIPEVAIVDPDMMSSMPKGLVAATGMDALTHSVEGYISLGGWEMTGMFHLKAMELISKNLRQAVAGDEKAIESMALAQYMAGMGFSNSGLGIVHSMAHTLGAKYDTPHGVANAILLPTIMKYNADAAGEKFKDIAKALGVSDVENMSEKEYKEAAINTVKKLAEDVNIPKNLKEIIKEDDLDFLSESAYADACRPGNPRETSVEEIKELYKSLL